MLLGSMPDAVLASMLLESVPESESVLASVLLASVSESVPAPLLLT